MLKLIAGLGNPGPDYAATRHNAGFWFLHRLAAQFSAHFSAASKFHGEVARLQAAGLDCRLLKPTTYMNESGRALKAMADYFNIAADELLVVHDEIDLDAGLVRLKQGGGHGGHNGVCDIISRLVTPNFLRLRIGVSRPGRRADVTPHVLGRPGADEQALIEEAMERALSVMPQLFAGEYQKAMSALNSAKHTS